MRIEIHYSDQILATCPEYIEMIAEQIDLRKIWDSEWNSSGNNDEFHSRKHIVANVNRRKKLETQLTAIRLLLSPY